MPAATDAGPLDVVDDGSFPYLALAPRFVDLVNNHIADTYPHHDALSAAQDTIAAASDATAFESDAGGAIDEADNAHATNAYTFENADPSDVQAQTNAHSDAVDGNRADYDETPPPEADIADPGPPPDDGGGGPPPEI